MIERLHDLIFQNCRNYGSRVYVGSCRISVINSSSPLPTMELFFWILLGMYQDSRGPEAPVKGIARRRTSGTSSTKAPVVPGADFLKG